jgi:hypothetical protein
MKWRISVMGLGGLLSVQKMDQGMAEETKCKSQARA